MTKTKYAALCLVPTVIGTIIGWNVGDKIGIAALPLNAWAGDGIGILIDDIRYSGWGALIGFGFGLVCCLVLHVLVLRSRYVLPLSLPPDDSVWPPPPAS